MRLYLPVSFQKLLLCDSKMQGRLFGNEKLVAVHMKVALKWSLLECDSSVSFQGHS